MANLLKYVGVAFKGACMGAADVIPGVSGGTIAFLMGIYQELLDSIKSVNGEAFKLLFKGKIADFWKHIIHRCCRKVRLWKEYSGKIASGV